MKGLDLKQYDAMLAAARDAKAADLKTIEPLRQAHIDALAELQRVEGEREVLRSLVAEFENNLDSGISGDEYERARLRLDTMDILVKRAQRDSQVATNAWQVLQRQAQRRWQVPLREFTTVFDADAGAIRDEYLAKFQALR